MNTINYDINCAYDDPNDCRVYNCYCSLNGLLTSTTFTPYVDEYVDLVNCRLIGICQNGEHQIESTGTFQTEYHGEIIDNTCCASCFEVYGCNINGKGFIPYDSMSIEPTATPTGVEHCFDIDCGTEYLGEICFPPTATAPLISNGSNTKEILSHNITVGDYFLAAYHLGVIDKSINLGLIEGIELSTTLHDANNVLKSRKRLSKVTTFTYEQLKAYHLTNTTNFSIAGIDTGSSSKNNYLVGDYSIFPVPFEEEIKITFTSPVQGETDVKIYSSTGKLVKQLKYDVVAGANLLTVNTAELINGIYIFEISGNNLKTHQSKIIKQ
ncbi:MAG: T9SS type A sorting domain-containing protein [Saprospiraceae bacterium]|nr:T9SS type A sorting domain-containing protein [Saprospiraceae bacterium]